MSNTLMPVDISKIPELSDIVDEMEATQEPRALTRGNKVVAVLSPVNTTKHTVSEETRQRSLAALGSWSDIDPLEAVDRISRWRTEGSRPPTRP